MIRESVTLEEMWNRTRRRMTSTGIERVYVQVDDGLNIEEGLVCLDGGALVVEDPVTFVTRRPGWLLAAQYLLTFPGERKKDGQEASS